MQEVSGSIPLTSTKNAIGNMHRLGVVTSWIGVISCAIGLVVGFIQLPGGDGSVIGFWLSLTPIGFVLLLTGIVMTQLSRKQ